MSASATNSRAASREPIRDFLSGDGELGALLRDYPWDTTPAGTAGELAAEPENGDPDHADVAPADLDRLGRGADLSSTTTPTSPSSAASIPGRWADPTREVWSEIWPQIGPMLDTALGGDEGTYVESQLLIMERNGYPEETYYTFSYSPIPNDDGSVGGIICANSDDTQRVIGERQLALLRDLAADARPRAQLARGLRAKRRRARQRTRTTCRSR